MKIWIGSVVIAAGLVLLGPMAIGDAAAADFRAVMGASKVTDLSARRRERHHTRYAYQARYRPYYEDRPNYYRPYPYAAPVPFFLGFGFGPSW
jgi:hypothetical protein